MPSGNQAAGFIFLSDPSDGEPVARITPRSVPRTSPFPSSRPAFSVVMPVCDEADGISGLLDELRESLQGAGDYEIVVVDDGSRDDTRRRLIAARAGQGPAIRILCHRENLGQSAALRSGIRAARADWVVTLDGDGQNDPRDIPRVLGACRGGESVQLVCGYRRRRNDPLSKVVSSRIANAVRRRLLSDGAPDSGCGLKVIHRQTFLALPFFDHMHRFLPALMAGAGARVLSVEVNHRPRAVGRSKYGIRDRLWAGLIDIAGVLWLQRRHKSIHATELGGDDDTGID